MNIVLGLGKIRFRNPEIGQPTLRISEHYNGRRVQVFVDGEEQVIRLYKEDVPFDATEDEILQAIENKLNSAG